MTPSSNPVLEDSQVSFKATPNGDYVFTGWSGSLSGTENPKAVTVTADMSVTANFVLRDYPLTLSVEGEGSIEEKVISTKTDYSSGTVVELTAVPAAGWSFGHWEGDSSGSENPVQITVSSAKSVKAVFTKNHYLYNLTIVGPGVVDEYLVEDTKATLEYGTRVLLKALPSENAVFKGWSGDLSGTELEVMVSINQSMDIVAEFVGKDVLSYPLTDLSLPSCMLEQLYDGVDVSPYVDGAGYILLDYNRDGRLDLVTSKVMYDGMTPVRCPIHFYLGDSQGGFSVDPENDSKFKSIDSRKILQGDFNGDGFPDIFLLGHGYDAEPWPGEYPIILLSNTGPSYTEHRFTEHVAFFHGGGSADYDNDGDLDIFITGSSPGTGLLFVNDGKGSFEIKMDIIDQELIASMYTCEMMDIDKDGYVDLVLGGHDHEGPFSYPEGESVYKNMPTVFWGNGSTFNNEDYVRLPKPPLPYGVSLDYYFTDLNSDGVDEIIVVRTSDGANGNVPYQGWKLQVIERSGRLFQDVTDKYFSGNSYDASADSWIDKICFQEIDGKQYLLAKAGGPNPIRLFTFSNGQFARVSENRYSRLEAGQSICHVQSSLDEGWGMYAALVYPFENGVDLTYLVENEYSLEFYIKNTDPSLRFDIHFDTSVLNSEGNNIMYGAGVDLSSLKHDGSWERIIIPMNSIELWDESKNNYWNRISQFVIITTSTGGHEFSVKDIRIRKVLPEE